MDRVGDATLGLKSHLTNREKMNSFLEIRKDPRNSSAVGSTSQRILNQISSLAGQPQLTIMVPQKQYFLETTQCMLNYPHNGPFGIAKMYLSSSVFSVFFGLRRKSFLVLCCLSIPHFCCSYYFTKSDSWYSVSFQFPFMQSPNFPFCCVNHCSV